MVVLEDYLDRMRDVRMLWKKYPDPEDELAQYDHIFKRHDIMTMPMLRQEKKREKADTEAKGDELEQAVRIPNPTMWIPDFGLVAISKIKSLVLRSDMSEQAVFLEIV